MKGFGRSISATAASGSNTTAARDAGSPWPSPHVNGLRANGGGGGSFPQTDPRMERLLASIHNRREVIGEGAGGMIRDGGVDSKSCRLLKGGMNGTAI